MRTIYSLFLAGLLMCSCTPNNLNPTNNITGKIKSIKLVEHNNATDSTVTQYNFYYKQDGLLDSMVVNNFSIGIENYSVEYNNVNILVKMNKLSNNAGYIITDSMVFQYNTSKNLILTESIHKETDNCSYRISRDSSEFIVGNLSKFMYSVQKIGCEPGTTYSLNDIGLFFYSSQINSLTNENIGMPYCGVSSYYVIDSFVYTNCFFQDSVNSCYTRNTKAVNISDAEGRIVKTNIIPPLGFDILLYTNYFVKTTNNNDLYEISYY